MRKAFLTVLLVSVIVFVSISFMAASCIVTPGPGPNTYTLTIYNNTTTYPIRIIYNGVVVSNVVYSGNTYLDSVAIGTNVDAQYEFPTSSNQWYYIRGASNKFPFSMPGFNNTVSVINEDIGASSER